MIAVFYVTSRKYRVHTPETPTVDVPAGFDESLGNAAEDGGFLAYRNAAGDDSFFALDKTRKLSLRKRGEVCLLKSAEVSEDGRTIWILSKVEGRV
jgi:hypothetical protein